MSAARHVFAYGSLMFAPVWRHVTGREDVGEPARALGFRRTRLRGLSYPGMFAAPGHATHGRLYRDVDAGGLAVLDAFEGEPYRRATIEVAGPGGSEQADAWLFVDRDLALEADWEPATFERDALDEFLATYCRRVR